jgi:NADH dehydrogenase/putative oxidoreductase
LRLVAWLDPFTTAMLGVAVEVGGAVLLASGLATRYAAIAMAALALTIQFHSRAFDSQLYWTAILLWYGVNGAGPLSLDRILGRGLGASALPGAALLTRIGAWSQRELGPHYQFALRWWFAAAGTALWFGPQETTVLPVASLVIGIGGHGARCTWDSWLACAIG